MKIKTNPNNAIYARGIAITLLSIFLAISFTAQAAYQDKKEIDLLLPENRDIRGVHIHAAQNVSELLLFIESQLGISFNEKFLPWNRAIITAQNSDQLIFGLSHTEERAKYFEFSEPAFYNTIWLVTRRDNPFPFKTLQDLKGKRIGILRGSFYGGEFDEQRNKIFQVEDDIDSTLGRLQKLHNRRMDAFLIASPLENAKDVEHYIHTIIQKNQPQENSNLLSFTVLNNPVLKDGIRFAHRKGVQSEILSRIDTALEKYHRLQKKNR
jgi:polar amino acid transport system substrate-binding protein